MLLFPFVVSEVKPGSVLYLATPSRQYLVNAKRLAMLNSMLLVGREGTVWKLVVFPFKQTQTPIALPDTSHHCRGIYIHVIIILCIICMNTGSLVIIVISLSWHIVLNTATNL